MLVVGSLTERPRAQMRSMHRYIGAHAGYSPTPPAIWHRSHPPANSRPTFAKRATTPATEPPEQTDRSMRCPRPPLKPQRPRPREHRIAGPAASLKTQARGLATCAPTHQIKDLGICKRFAPTQGMATWSTQWHGLSDDVAHGSNTDAPCASIGAGAALHTVPPDWHSLLGRGMPRRERLSCACQQQMTNGSGCQP